MNLNLHAIHAKCLGFSASNDVKLFRTRIGTYVSSSKRAIREVEVAANPLSALKVVKRRKKSKLSSSRSKRELPRKQKLKVDEGLDPDISQKKKPRF